MRLALASVILCVPSLALAWGGDGHQIVCLIAEERLSAKAKTAIHELLGHDTNISDAEVCLWADQIRRERRATAPWHYVNIPTSQPAYDVARDSKGGENVIDAIGRFEKVLTDTTAPRQERKEALLFLVHFVGDIHQPLHCADRDGDKGGNSRLVFFMERSRAVNLHQVWDSLILIQHRGRVRVADYADALNAKIGSVQAANWAKGTRIDWANESHRIAVDRVYAAVPRDGAPPKLNQKYVDDGGAVIDEQLQKAGVRLALILNRTFADARDSK